MRKRLKEEQIIAIPKQSEAGKPTRELCREHGISPNTFYAWRRKFGGMEVEDARRLKQLEEENRKLKQLAAELTLDKKGLEFSTRRCSSIRPMLGERSKPGGRSTTRLDPRRA